MVNTTLPATAAPQEGALQRLSETIGIDVRLLGMVGVLAALWIVLNVLTNGIFLSPRNLINLTQQVAVVGIMATGMVLVIVSRNIDLSVGSLLGFVGMIGAIVQVQILAVGVWYNWVLTVIVMLGAGALIGALQGYWIAYRRVPAFIVTLGGLLIFRNGAWVISDGKTISPMDETFQVFGGGINGTIGATWSWVVGIGLIVTIVVLAIRSRRNRMSHGFTVRPLAVEWLLVALWIGLVVAFVTVVNSYNRPRTEIPSGFPVPFLILLLTTAAMIVLSRWSRFGRYVFAIGGNPEAAQLSGIDVKRVVLLVFTLMGFLAGLAAIVVTARLNAAASVTGTLTELNVIAAAVIGGTSLSGGVGTVIGAVIGAVIMQSLESGMVLLGVPTPLQKIVVGIVLVLAVWVDVIYRRQPT